MNAETLEMAKAEVNHRSLVQIRESLEPVGLALAVLAAGNQRDGDRRILGQSIRVLTASMNMLDTLVCSPAATDAARRIGPRPPTSTDPEIVDVGEAVFVDLGLGSEPVLMSRLRLIKLLEQIKSFFGEVGGQDR